MASGYPGGGGGAGGGEFYGGNGIPGRSMIQNGAVVPNNNNPNPFSLPNPYRPTTTNIQHQQQQLPQIFLDQTTTNTSSSLLRSQIPHHRFTQPTPSPMIGKRTLAEFQAAQHHQFYNRNHQQQQFQQQQFQQQQNSNNMSQAALSNLLMLRSVKPRHMVAQSPISTLSSLEHSPSNDVVFHPQQRYQPLQQNQQQQLLRAASAQPAMIQAGPPVMTGHQDPSFSVEQRLQELEKHLLDDDDDDLGLEGDENDVASVITSIDSCGNNSSSEWSEPLNLIAPTTTTTTTTPQNPISPSPTTSSSSSSSSSVTNPVPSACTRQTLLEAASAISESRNDVGLEILSRAAVQPPPNAGPEQKMVGFLAGALRSRVNPADNPPPVSEMFSRDHAESTRSLYELSPCFKLGFMAANLAILDAARGRDAIHVIDFDVGLGAGQYVNLLHVLSSACGSAPSLLKLTAVHDREDDGRLADVSEMLGRVGERIGVQFRFQSVELGRLGGVTRLTRASLGVDEDEAVAVNFAFRLYRVPDESVSVENPRDELLRRVRGMSPLVVTLVEQEMNVNTAPFLTRVGESCAYYGALLESMEATVARESVERAKAEAGFARRVANAVVCEGRDRVERCEVFGKWRARLGMAGFGPRPMGQGIAESMRSRVNPVGGRVNPGFTVNEESGGVCFGWMGKTLTVASAWR